MRYLRRNPARICTHFLVGYEVREAFTLLACSLKSTFQRHRTNAERNGHHETPIHTNGIPLNRST